MKMIMKFEAPDGRLFDTEVDCIKYELNTYTELKDRITTMTGTCSYLKSVKLPRAENYVKACKRYVKEKRWKEKATKEARILDKGRAYTELGKAMLDQKKCIAEYNESFKKLRTFQQGLAELKSAEKERLGKS